MTKAARHFPYCFTFQHVVELWQRLRGTHYPENPKTPLKGRSAYFSTDLLIHVVGIGGAVTIITLNFASFWIGKELSGPINQNGVKMLLLQITAKVHELTMQASLSSIVCSYILGLLTSRKPLPLGALIATQNFRQLSFLWSTDFMSMCISKFQGKPSVLAIILVATLLGFSVGPSSATGLIPTLTDWPAARMRFTMDTAPQDLWPVALDFNQSISTSLEELGSADKVSILTNNLFKFWGRGGLNHLPSMIETVSLPGKTSIRSLSARFRGAATWYSPPVTAVTIQSVAVADTLASLYWLWNAFNTPQCRWTQSRQQGSQCTFQDVKSVVTAQQPVVYVKCAWMQNSTGFTFPVIHGEGTPPSSTTSSDRERVTISKPANSSASSIEWTDLTPRNLSTDSVGVLVRPIGTFRPNSVESTMACTISAQWANATAQSSWLQGPYQVTGMPDHFFDPSAVGSLYKGQQVKISPSWAASANPLLDPRTSNITVFDKLFSAGSLHDQDADIHKAEAILAVLIAEHMSWVASSAYVLAEVDVTNRDLQPANVSSDTASRADASTYTFDFTTTVSGYGYGLRRSAGLSEGNLLAMIVLLAYCTVTVLYLITRVLTNDVYIDAWDNVTELLCLALQSPPNSKELVNAGAGVERLSTLMTPVEIVRKEKKVLMVTGQDQRRADPECKALVKYERYG